MSFLDKTIGYVSPQWALKRARAQAALRVYEAAQPTRRSTSWRSRATSQNSEMFGALGPLRDRARNMVRNSPWGPRLLDILTAHTIGTGLRPVVDTGDDALDKKVVELWEEWNDSADIEGSSFDAMQALAFRSMVESGDVVIRFVDQSLRRSRNSGSPVPLRLQLLEGDFIDHQRDGLGYGEAPGTKRSRLGVGLGQWDVRTGLWLFETHPGEMTTASATTSLMSKFVPSEYVTHIYHARRPGQVRGVSWFAPMLMMAGDLADFMDAQVMKAKVEACFSAFITNDNEYDDLMPASPDSDALQSGSNPGAEVTTLEPGLIKELAAGQDIKFAQPTQASQIEPNMMFPLMAMAASVGVTYDQLSGDLRGANYSSLRAGKIDFRRLTEQNQNHVILPRMCRPVWNRFIDRCILAGLIPEGKNYKAMWVTPAWESINPKFDQNAEELSVRAGRMSPQEFIAQWGSDWRKVQDDFKKFFDRADKLNLKFDIDPRTMTKAGTFQPVPGQGAGGPPGDLTDASGNPVDTEALQEIAQSDAHDNERAMTLIAEMLSEAEDSLAHHSKYQPRDSANGKWRPNKPIIGPRIKQKLEALAAAKSALADEVVQSFVEWNNAPAEEAGRGVPFGREFNEEDHPRDDSNGQFTDGGGSGAGGGASVSAPSSSSGGRPAGKSSAKGLDTSHGQEANQAAKVGGPTGSAGQGSVNAGGHPRGASAAYGSRSPRSDEGSGLHVARVFEPTDSERSILEARGATPLTLFELESGSGKSYRGALEASKTGSKFGAAVTLYDPEHYDNLRTFMTADGKAGFALDGGDIVSVFKHPDADIKQGCASLLALAVEQGGRRLDCFDTVLPIGYSREGFVAVARTKFDDTYKPDGWDYETFKPFNDGRPDVVFMKYEPGAAPYKQGDGKMYDSYDEASAAQKDAVSARGIRRREFNEEDHPRDEDGKFTDGGGSDSGGGDGASAPAASAQGETAADKHPINEAVADTGGDEWNTSTGRRLEQEYANARPAIERSISNVFERGASESIGGDEDSENYTPEEWDGLSGDQQADAEAAYKDQNLSSEMDYQIENWQDDEQGGATRDAMERVANDFNKASNTEWADDALKGAFTFKGEPEEEGKTPLPFAMNDIVLGVKIEVNDGDKASQYKPTYSIDFDEDTLNSPTVMPEGYSADQEPLPGFDKQKPGDLLSGEAREEIVSILTEAISDETDSAKDKLEPPEYLKDSALESLGESWDSMDDNDKFSFVENNTSILEDSGGGGGGGEETSLDSEPEKLDPVGYEDSSTVYNETRVFARAVSRERAADIFVERGLADSIEDARSEVGGLDERLWSGWVSSSTSPAGKLLQVATAKELGGRLRTTGKNAIDPSQFSEREIKEAQAIVRAKWETTQYMLDKAGLNHLVLYRGLGVDAKQPSTSPRYTVKEVAEKPGSWGLYFGGATSPVEQFGKKEQADQVAADYNAKAENRNETGIDIGKRETVTTERGTFTKLPDVQIARNGALSTTSDRHVANGWSGSGSTKLTMRFDVPRTAVISVPAYGKNIHSEHELVIAGTAYRNWDVWEGHAPSGDKRDGEPYIPVETHRRPEQRA